MRQLRTIVGDLHNGDLALVDTVHYEGRPWLVAGGWLTANDDENARPVRIIRPLSATFQAGGQWKGRWADYILPVPVSPAIVDGLERPSANQFEIVEAPDLTAAIAS